MTPFIPAEELSGLLRGSFQETSILVSEAVKAEKQRFGNTPAHVVATFPEYAVVMSESGMAFRVGYGISEDGTVHLTKQEPLSVRVVTEENLRKYVQQEAKAAVDLFLSGLTDRANEKISALLPLADAGFTASDAEVIASFAESRKQDRLWKQLLAERGEGIKEFLAESAPSAPELKAKFKKLYDGSTTADELPTFKGLVQEDAGHLMSRLDRVKAQAEAALHVLRTFIDEAADHGGTDVFDTLESYTNDLLADVRAVQEFVTESMAEFSRVDLLAQVFDAVASDVASFEVAGAFASKMATRLAEAGR